MDNTSVDYKEGITLLVDKPLEWSSFDVVNKLRWQIKKKLGVKKIKVGHAGTLDPLATGLLVICVGKHTKLINDMLGADKTYTGTIQLGSTTPSFDLETAIDAEYPTKHITQDLINDVKQQFEGPLMQLPPNFSAKKVNGVRAYELAREGVDAKLEAKPVVIHSLFCELDERSMQIYFEVKCSKGTYIRSLANDLGKALSSGGHLIKLRRVASGDHHIKDAKTIEEWVQIINET